MKTEHKIYAALALLALLGLGLYFSMQKQKKELTDDIENQLKTALNDFKTKVWKK